jgi:biotin carboxyl carrier protein
LPLSPSEIENIKKLITGSRLTEIIIEQDGARTVIGGATATLQTAQPIAVTAPRTGTIVLGGLEVGQSVADGEIVARLHVLEDETPIPAPQAGRVLAILAEEGALVSYGAELILIEPETAS